jgi:16S rRNA (cytosine1407-C5)-methyltransferase
LRIWWNKKIKTDPGGFNAFYGALYGSRWKELQESLLLPAASISYGDGLAVPYYLDSASVLAARSLRLPKDGLILDACAAPGGKTLVLASKMGKDTELLANALSAESRRRLTAVLDKHLLPEERRRVRVSGFDAAAAAGRQSERGRFAAVLLDAPCSSERHVLQSKAALERWTPARPRNLARRQWALLSAAFLLLAPGGSLVYVTCSLNPAENDGAAERLIKKYGDLYQPAPEGSCIVEPPDFPEGEATAYGRIILPDVSGGSGPLYVARFKKSREGGPG